MSTFITASCQLPPAGSQFWWATYLRFQAVKGQP